jgi:hypothetical protein
MKQPKFVITMLAMAVLVVGMTFAPVPRANGQVGIQFGWQQPPNEYNDVQRQGFHAGLDAARHDIDGGLAPDPQRHSDFRHPQGVPQNLHDDFRHGFENGYQTAYQHRGDGDPDHHDSGQPR